MQRQPIGQAAAAENRTFGRRKIAPRACVLDKPHLQKLLCETLEEAGFVARRLERDGDVAALLAEYQPDLFLVGLSSGGIEAAQLLEVLAALGFTGRILVVGEPASLMTKSVQQLGSELGLGMLPVLSTPFSEKGLRIALADFLPRDGAVKPLVDVAEALHSGWLELWYQPKVDLRSLSLCGAEALIRMRHPSWGLVEPAAFLPDENDPHFLALSEFVVARAADDWHYFLDHYGPVELAINLPVSFFEGWQAASRLISRMPDHPAFQGVIVEINGIDVIQNGAAAVKVADKLRFHNIAVALDDVGPEWPGLLQLERFPFSEIKVDRSVVAGCADDRLNQVICRRILEFAADVGARTVAEGVETRADFIATRELGFDTIQG
jgi:EAL domain-containing protein (putative c-di-GMP-specific phosphodiesterase class I)